MSLLSTFRVPAEAGGRSWTRAERELAPRRTWLDRLLGRTAVPEASWDGFGDQRARALAAEAARHNMQVAYIRPRPWR